MGNHHRIDSLSDDDTVRYSKHLKSRNMRFSLNPHPHSHHDDDKRLNRDSNSVQMTLSLSLGRGTNAKSMESDTVNEVRAKRNGLGSESERNTMTIKGINTTSFDEENGFDQRAYAQNQDLNRWKLPLIVRDGIKDRPKSPVRNDLNLMEPLKVSFGIGFQCKMG